MSKYAVTTGIQNSPVKTVLYGPEGIGKSTFASHFPNPVFIDTEGGTKRLNVKRLPQPTSWAMLLDEVHESDAGNERPRYARAVSPAARWSLIPPTGLNACAFRPCVPKPR